MDWKLELVPIPVSDVDRAKAFYAEKVGFDVDLDVSAETDSRVSDGRRIVQLTPPGSACSVAFGIGVVDTPPGSVQALHLVVSDIEAARAELVERGVEVGEVQDLGGVLYAPFRDPDGNGWTLQQLPYQLAATPTMLEAIIKAGLTQAPDGENSTRQESGITASGQDKPPTGKRDEVAGTTVARLVNAKIVELWKR